MMHEPRFLKTSEAARILGLQSKTLERWRWAGRGPAYRKLGSAVRYDSRELERWAESCRRASTSDTGECRETKDAR